MIFRCRPDASCISGLFWSSFESSSHFRSWPEATTVFGLLLERLQDADFVFELGDGLGGRRLIDELFFEGFLLVGVQVVVILGDVVEGFGQRWPCRGSPSFSAEAVRRGVPCGV